MNSLLWWAVMVGMIWSRLVPESYAGEIRIACLGTSITQGVGIVHRERNCYPAQLQAMLGEKYKVRNFGAGGATLLQRGDLPDDGRDCGERHQRPCFGCRSARGRKEGFTVEDGVRAGA